jgi:L-fucose mutarotase
MDEPTEGDVRDSRDGEGAPQWQRRDFMKLSAAAALGAGFSADPSLGGSMEDALDQQNTHTSGDTVMLKGRLLHPQILEALGRAGHGSQVLIADGNYPFSTKLGPRAELVNLNLSPGIVNCTQVLESLLTAIPIESAAVMAYDKTGPYALQKDPEIWDEFRVILRKGTGQEVPLDLIDRFEFYDVAGTPNVALSIATAEQRIFANLLLTVGVVMPE